MVRAAQLNGQTSYTPVLTSTGFSTGSPQRLRVRWSQVALFASALLLCAALLVTGWGLGVLLLPFNGAAIVLNMPTQDPLTSIRTRGR